MPTYQIGLEDGRSLKIEADSQEAALAGVQHFQDSEKPSGLFAGGQQGLANIIHGPAESIKTFGGFDTSGMENAAKAVAPDNYKSSTVLGPGSHWYNPASYNWKGVPQMLAENAPQIGEAMLGATAGQKLGGKFGPWGRLIGGAVGSAAPFVMNTAGDRAKSDVVARTGDANAEPAREDKIRAALTTLAMAVPQAIGVGRLVNPGAVAAVASKGVAQSLAKGAVTTGIEGATGAASNAIGQAGDTIGTPVGLKIDPNQVAEAGVGQGIIGGAIAAPRMLGNAYVAQKYAKFGGDNAASAERLAGEIKQAAAGSDIGSRAVGDTATKQAVSNRLAALKDANSVQGGTSTPEAGAAVQRVLGGNALSDSALANIKAGSTPELAKLALDAHVANMYAGTGNSSNGKFTGGIARHIERIVSPSNVLKAGAVGVMGGAAGNMLAYSPHTLFAIASAYGLARATDAVTGNRNPAESFVNKFGTGSSAAPAPMAPQPPPPEPPTTSVPQVAPPSAPAQPWGAPAPAPAPPMTPADMNQQIKSMLLMAAARRKVDGQQQAKENPMTPADMNQQIKSMLLMAAARRKVDGQQQAEAEAKDSHAINEQGGLNELSNPALGKRAKELLSNADAMRRLRAAPPETPDPKAIPSQIPSFLPKRAADVPAAPVDPAAAQMPATSSPVSPAPADPVGPSISDLIARMKAKAAGPQLPPETIVKTNGGAVNVKTTEPVGDTTKPYLDKVVDKSAPRDHVKSDAQKRMAPTGADLSEAYTPLQDHELFGKDFTHKEFGAYEAKLFNNKMVEKAAERDRVKNAAKKNKMAPTEDVLAKETPMHDHEDLTHNEFGAYEPIKNKSGVRDLESYSLGVQRDHRSYEHILQALSQHSVGVDDTPALQRLLTELYHVRRADTALRAVNHFSQLMTPALRDRVRSRLDVSFVRSHWSKHSKDE